MLNMKAFTIISKIKSSASRLNSAAKAAQDEAAELDSLLSVYGDNENAKRAAKAAREIAAVLRSQTLHALGDTFELKPSDLKS
jgi:glutamate-1-semialdehyde aminotransferase